MKKSVEKQKAMLPNHMRRCYLILVAIIACAALLCGNDLISVQADDEPKRPEYPEQQNPVPDEQEPIKGYPVRKRRIGTPTDVEWDLDNSFPKRDSLLELIPRCRDNQDR